MPETTFAPAVSSSNSSDKTGDARLGNTSGYSPPTWNVAGCDIGRITAGKTSANYGYVAHYDTSAIPTGAKIKKAKLEMRAHSTKTVATTIDVDVLGPDPRLNKNNETAVDGRMIYTPETGSHLQGVSLWSNSSKTFSSTPNLKWYQDRRYGVRGYAQAWTANNPNGEQLYRSHWMMIRDDNDDWWYHNRFRTNIYEAEGSPGNWRRGALVNEGADRLVYNISTTSFAEYHTWSGGQSLNWPRPVHGKTYISELIFMGATGSGYVNVAWIPSADGSNENVLTIAQDGLNRGDGEEYQSYTYAFDSTHDATVHRVQGFADTGVAFKSSAEVANMAGTGTQDSNIAFPSHTANELYTMGHSDYSPSGTLPNLTSNLQTALSNRSSTSDWIGIRMQDFTTTVANAGRKIWTSKGTTATRDSLYGLLLTIDWEVDAEIVSVEGEGTSKAFALGSGSSRASASGEGVSSQSASGEGISKASVERLGTYGIETENPTGSGTSKTSIIGD